MKKLAILVTIWKRPQITHLMLKYLYDFKIRAEKERVRVKIYVTCSRAKDEILPIYGEVEMYRLPNQPIGKKLNDAMGLMLCDTSFQWDYFMQMGSDDFLTDYGAKLLLYKLHCGRNFFGFRRIGIINLKTLEGRDLLANGVYGAARCMSRALIQSVLSRKKLWVDYRNDWLDGCSQKAILQTTGIKPKEILCDHVPLIDVKTKQNINSWEVFKELGNSDPNLWRNIPELDLL